MRITSVADSDLFGGTAGHPLQLVRVTVLGDRRSGTPAAAGRGRRAGHGPGRGARVSTPVPVRLDWAPPGAEAGGEVGVDIAVPAAPGSPRQVTAIAEFPGAGRSRRPRFRVAETGWTMWMVSHFHYDPVWWDTQGDFTESRLLLPGEDGSLPEVRTAFELMAAHLDEARRDPDYKFVLAEIDYLKPYLDTHPGDRADLRRFLAEGQVEIVGGSYNEPNTNLTGAESTIRNAVYGLAYQRDVAGGDRGPRGCWTRSATTRGTRG